MSARSVIALLFIVLAVVAVYAEPASAAKSLTKRRVGGYGSHVQQIVSGGARQAHASGDIDAAFIRMPTTADRRPAAVRGLWGKRFFRTAGDVLTDAYADDKLRAL